MAKICSYVKLVFAMLCGIVKGLVISAFIVGALSAADSKTETKASKEAPSMMKSSYQMGEAEKAYRGNNPRPEHSITPTPNKVNANAMTVTITAGRKTWAVGCINEVAAWRAIRHEDARWRRGLIEAKKADGTYVAATKPAAPATKPAAPAAKVRIPHKSSEEIVAARKQHRRNRDGKGEVNPLQVAFVAAQQAAAAAAAAEKPAAAPKAPKRTRAQKALAAEKAAKAEKAVKVEKAAKRRAKKALAPAAAIAAATAITPAAAAATIAAPAIPMTKGEVKAAARLRAAAAKTERAKDLAERQEANITKRLAKRLLAQKGMEMLKKRTRLRIRTSVATLKARAFAFARALKKLDALNIAAPDQADTDRDRLGDVCDTDDDNDGRLDAQDNYPLVANADQADVDTAIAGPSRSAGGQGGLATTGCNPLIDRGHRAFGRNAEWPFFLSPPNPGLCNIDSGHDNSGGSPPAPSNTKASKEAPNVVQPYTNLGRTIQAVKRRMKWRPVTSIELGGTQDTIKVIPGTAGADNIGLMAYCEGLGIEQPNAGDLFVIQANGVNESVVQAVAAAFVKKGWVPLTARLMVRVKNVDGSEASGAELVRRLSAVMGDTLNVRSYGSFLTAPALRVYERREELVTEREGGDPMEVLIFTGPAGQVFEGLNGTEGGLLCSEKAHEAIFATKKPGQPRVFINHPALVGSKAVEAMFKGNISPVAQRAFKQADGSFVFKARAHFGNDEAGKAEWRKGYDFLLIEEDTPKGAGAKELKTKKLTLWPDMHKYMFGWLLAEAQEEPGNSLVSYQVASLLSAVPPEVEGAIDASVEKRIARTYAQATNDLTEVGLPEDWVKWLAQFAPASNRASRQNHLGMGLQASTGYIHMNTLFGRGWIVTGDEFGGLKGKKLVARKAALDFDHTCGGKNPILDANQTWVGKLLRLSDVNKLLAELIAGEPSEKAKEIIEGFMPDLDNDQRIERLRWVLSFAPSLTRGSILMNSEDVADLAGDDDGDQLWFMVGDQNALAIFSEIKRQAKGNPDCSIENNKVAQRPSAIGERPLADLLTAQGSDLMAMVKFIMAPNKGQGPVGFLANLGTVLNTFFKKVPNDGGGLSFENEWVGKLQAVLNLMQQTAIDTQKREYIPVDPVRWTLSQLDRDVTGPRGLIPGYDFPAMGHVFDKLKVADPNNLTKAQYSAALTVTSIPMVPHHWSGTATSFLTATDTQYNLSALGSWLIWECVSLLATGKPADWGVEMASGAQGGLRPWEVAFSEDGPDMDAVFAQYNCSPETQAIIKRLWVDKASKLYAWKSAPKHKPYSMAAPPALEVNHRLALSHMAELTKDAVEPEVNEAEMLARLNKKFKMNLTAEVLSRWVKDVIEAFYVNAAINQGQKADSERFQHSSERSGVESLRYLVDAVETAGDKNTRNKMGSLASLWLNTHSRIDQDEREKGLAELAMIFAWWQVKYGWQWVVEESLVLLNANHHKHKAGAKLVDTWTNLGVPADMVGKVVNYMGRYRNNQRRKPSDEVMGILLDVLALNGVDMERKQARQFFFTDDALGALIKCKENALLVREAKDNREALGETIRTWQESRRDWSDDQLPIEIMREAFGAGKALWFEEVTDGLDDLAKQVLTPEQVKALPRGKSAERSKHLKAVKARQMLEAVEAYKAFSSTVKTEEIFDQLFNPGMNPLAELFTRKIKDASGPVLNVERAWARATEADRDSGDWCLDLGEEVTYSKRDPETGSKAKKKKFVAFSRIEWSLPSGIEAEFTRTLLEGGVSFYKLSKLYTDSVKAWRYFDAVAHKALGSVETDLSLVYGLGHLISEAVSTTVAERRKESRSKDALARYVRREYIAQLEEDLKGMNKGPDADAYVQGLREFLTEEKARLAAIETSPLFGLWGGGLRFPATWGMTLRSFASELTTKKLNGRAMNAIITAGRKNPHWHEQPQVIEGEGGVQAADVTTALEPVWENVNRAVPWDKPKSRHGLNRRAAMRQAKQDLDDSVGLVPFELEGAKMSYEKWLEDIKAIIVDNDNDARCLLPAALWFKGHIGRIGSLCGGEAAPEMIIPMQKALMKTPARDIQLHLLDLLNSEELPPQPKFQRLDCETVEAFFAVIEEITKR